MADGTPPTTDKNPPSELHRQDQSSHEEPGHGEHSAGGVTLLTRGGHPDFLDLPWGQPLAEWDHPRLVPMAHGISRHIVRFVRYDDRVYALKETQRDVARAEYEILRDLRDEHLPVVEPVGVATDLHPTQRPADGPHSDSDPDSAMLITRYLDFSLPYWYVLGRDGPLLADNLLDAAAVLLVRLHLENIFWGDCSLSNILFRRDAGAMMAYLVDAETTERAPSITDEMRAYDLTIARENVAGGLLDLQAQGRVGEDVDAVAIADDLAQRYEQLWNELTEPEEFSLDERWRIERRVRRLNDLGFDIEEMSISRDGTRLRIKPVLIEEGHHARELRRRTGLAVQENQARRLLADISSFRVWLERSSGKEIPQAVAAARWLADIYEPVVEAIPPEMAERLEPVEVFHQVLEHRYYLSERRQSEVDNLEALDDYMRSILSHRPLERQLQLSDDTEGDDRAGPEDGA